MPGMMPISASCLFMSRVWMRWWVGLEAATSVFHGRGWRDRCGGHGVHFGQHTHQDQGLGAGQASDLRWVEACARRWPRRLPGTRSWWRRAPCRCARRRRSRRSWRPRRMTRGIARSFSVLSNPEFLAEGTAIRDLEAPDRVLIGGEDAASIDALAAVYGHWVPDGQILRTNLWSSELSKLTANAFLAQRISSINSIAAFCERPPVLMCARWRGRSAPTVGSVRSFSMPVRGSGAVASRRTSSTWCISAAISVCRKWRITGRAWCTSTPGSSTGSRGWWCRSCSAR